MAEHFWFLEMRADPGEDNSTMGAYTRQKPELY